MQCNNVHTDHHLQGHLDHQDQVAPHQDLLTQGMLNWMNIDKIKVQSFKTVLRCTSKVSINLSGLSNPKQTVLLMNRIRFLTDILE